MGKKVRKKARSSHKDKRVSTSSPKAVPQENSVTGGTAADGDSVGKERDVCVHFEKAIDLGIVSSKLESTASTGCEDCREGAIDRRAGKGKGKHSRKKGTSDSKGGTKATWVCLQCGHFSCGGIGLPTSPQSHAVRHAKQSRHPLVIQVENPHLRWCFSCSTLIPVDKLENIGEQKDALSDIVKLLKKQSSKGSSADVEDIWFGSGSVVTELKSEIKEIDVLAGKDFYAVRGLVNLGNTCFLNSVLQNLLAMDILREYLLKHDGYMGPLTSSLKKIFVETSSETGLRNVVNPRPLFGCVCAKAPQFRGYQQQDSHELLRYLLDGLSMEELCAKKTNQSASLENQESQPMRPSFVDSIFGGQLSSTVCCVECGHSSVVYEPFLDLSLPVPTKKPPLKKAPSGPRTRKAKLPPKRGGRPRPKVNKDEDSSAIRSGCNPSSSYESSSGVNGASSSCSSSAKHVQSGNLVVVAGNGVSQNSSNSSEQEYSSMQVSACGEQRDEQGAGCLAWLDYLEPVPLLDGQNVAAENEELPVSVDSCGKEGNWHALGNAKSSAETIVPHMDTKPNSESTIDDLGNDCPSQVHGNEILLLTYKEDSTPATEGVNLDAKVSCSALEVGEDTLGFDGLGDLFNEPEVDLPTSSVTNDFQAGQQLGNGLGGNSSESDGNEVDNTDSPVSIESCLAHFIKPELLSGEHAWYCENCSKLQQEKKQKVRKNWVKTSLVTQKSMPNYECSSSEMLQVSSSPSLNSCTISATHENGSYRLHENLTTLDAVQMNGLCQSSVLGKEKSSKQLENLNNGNLDVVNLQKVDSLQINGLCLTSIQENEGCSEQDNKHLHPPGGSNFVGPSDKSTLDSESGNDHSVSANHVPVEMVSGLHEEEIEDDIDSKCVKVMKDATKRILINKAPPILTIHLKRFGQDARGRLIKLNGYVGFKEYINLAPFLDSRPTERMEHIYHLVGVVEHSGSMRGGHYIAYVRGGDRCRGRLEEERPANTVWYYASDAYVREATLEEVLQCEAYLLFYEKIMP